MNMNSSIGCTHISPLTYVLTCIVHMHAISGKSMHTPSHTHTLHRRTCVWPRHHVVICVRAYSRYYPRAHACAATCSGLTCMRVRNTHESVHVKARCSHV